MTEIRTIINIIFLNITLSIVKLTAGIFTFSQSLVMEGIDSLMDSINSIIALLAVMFSYKEEDDVHPYGHGNIEYIASMLLSIFIIYTSIYLVISIANGSLSIESNPSIIALFVIVINLFVKVVTSIYLIKKGKKHSNTLIKTLGIENISDIPKSLIAIAGVSFSLLNFSSSADMQAGIVIGCLICISGITIFFESANNLLGKGAPVQVRDEVEQKALINGVEKVANVSMLKKGPYYIVIIDICVDSKITVEASHDIAHNVINSIKEIKGMRYVTVHIDPV